MSGAKITGETSAAIDFLAKWRPEGPWVLTAIQTDKKSIVTDTFTPARRDGLEAWLNNYNGQRNIYFHVNPTIQELTKKANREDIAEVAWLHVDIDPRAGEDLDDERERSLALLTTKLPQGVPAPTCVVFSGGGYQGFWRLQEPIPINGDLDKAEDAKRWNVQLELLFGADNCHNIDRIMRLPGTVNIPDARKIKKGRVPALSYLVSFDDALTYPLSDFTAAPTVQMGGEASFSSSGGGGTPVTISGNIERIDDASELDEWEIPDRVKIIMAQGSHPDQPKDGDNSRSAWLFDFCCQMIRHNVPDDVLFSIITDPAWPISESVLDFKGSSEKYAIKQIESAKLHAIDPALVYFNDKYAVIKNYGGRCLVVTEQFDGVLGRSLMTKMTLENFEKCYENKSIQIGVDTHGNPKMKPAGTWWRKHEKRRQYETIVFAPEQTVPADYYNMWKGFSVQSIPGDCTLFLDHLRDNVCGGNAEHFTYLMGWLARMIQRPGECGQVAIVLRGGRGVGKSFFAKEIGKLFGRHYMQISNSGHLVGNFNSHLRDLVLLFADEAFYANDKKHESILKTLVTEEMIAIEAKGVDVVNAPNYIHLIMASNDMHVIPAGGDERRFFVTDVGNDHQKDTAYFLAMATQLNNGGREALLHHLLTYDLDGFEVRQVPSTDALREQKLLSLNPEEEWWYHKLEEGSILREGDSWMEEVSVDALVDDYIEYTRRFNVTRRGNQITLGKFIKKVCPTLPIVRRMAEVEIPSGDGFTRRVTKRVTFYQLPTLTDCRAKWESLYGYGDGEWPPVVDQPKLGGGRGKDPF